VKILERSFVVLIHYLTDCSCWTVVQLKRFIEREQQSRFVTVPDDKASESSSVTTNTNITYPDVGEWAYGARFQSYVAACICTQQLAICTVFFSFIGENLLAVLQKLGRTGLVSTHVAVITVALPFVMALSFLPNLKSLAPVMVRTY